jgi:hypothetical protein
MLPGAGSATVRIAAVIPVILLVLLTSLHWLRGLMCGCERYRYVTDLSHKGMGTIDVLPRGPAMSVEQVLPGAPQRRDVTP